MNKKGIVLKSMYTVDFKDVTHKREMSEMMMSKMLDEIKYTDKRKFLRNIKAKDYCFRLTLTMKEVTL